MCQIFFSKLFTEKVVYANAQHTLMHLFLTSHCLAATSLSCLILFNTFFKGYVRSVLKDSRSITKNEAQLLASALRANYGKMFSSMKRKFLESFHIYILMIAQSRVIHE